MSISLSTATAAAVAATFTQPGHLVELDFSPILRYSSRGDESWNGFSWLNNNVNVGQRQDQPNGDASLTLTVGNADLAFGALCFLQAPQDIPVAVWAFYYGALGASDPVPYFSGVISDCAITEQSVTLTCLQAASGTYFAPRRRICAGTGFNRLLPPGRIISYAGQRYQILQSAST